MKQSTQHSEETKRKMSAYNTGKNNPFYGKYHSVEARKKMSEAKKGKHPSEKTRERMSEVQKGKHLSEEHKRKISKAKKGYKHSIETRKKLSEARKGRPSPMQGKHTSEKTKRKLSEALKGKFKGDKSSNWKGGEVKTICKVCGKEKYVPVAQIRKGNGKFCSQRCSGIWNVKHMKTKDTSIERLIEQELAKRNIPYLKQAPIEGIALVDFLLPNKIIVQCDGDYWHSRQINKGRDIAQDTVLFFKGYKVFRFWEKDIKKSVSKCIDRIMGDTL